MTTDHACKRGPLLSAACYLVKSFDKIT